MRIYISKPRKDGKRKAQYVFENGVRIVKLLTNEELNKEITRGTAVYNSRK